MNPLHLLVRCSNGVASRWRNHWFRLLGVRLGGYVWMRRVSIPRQWSDIEIEGGAALDDGVTLVCSGAAKLGKLTIRSGTYVNRFTIIMASERVTIGRDCLIGPHGYITDSDHGLRPGQPMREQPLHSAPVSIGDGVWLGAGVVVLKGVAIGEGAVIGAGAVVTKDVPAHAIAVGVPARVVAIRMEPEPRARS